MEEPHDMLIRERPPIFASNVESAPLSPRQRPIEEEPPRPNYLNAPRPGLFRPPPPPHNMSSLPPRRYGSFNAGQPTGGPPSPNTLRPQQPPPPPPPSQPTSQQQLLPGFQRRHTSADIRQHGWRPESSPFHPSNNQSPQWPPSPNRNPHDNTRETLAAYEMNKRPAFSHQTTPPLGETPPMLGGLTENGWTFANAKYPSRSNGPDPGPPTRRSSVVSSSVHALLNPSSESSADRDRDDCDPLEDRKRKRLA